MQARFGTTVAKYFEFLRSTMWLNFINVVLVSSLILVPQIFDDPTLSSGRDNNTSEW